MKNTDFTEIPISCEPAYAWLWNSAVTKDGVRERIDEMYAAGIRAFYVLAEPKEFRPGVRNTRLDPPYLSEEYLDLLHYASRVAKEKGMYTWLYDEGGFPSGSACGQIRAARPELARKILTKQSVLLRSGESLCLADGCLAAFCGSDRVYGGAVFDTDRTVTEYFAADDERHPLLTDNADPRVTAEFIRCTHEPLYSRFCGENMIMFDDEAAAGSWTAGFDVIFQKKYGYDIKDFLPLLAGDAEPESEAQYRAKSDYAMLLGELLCENYFATLRRWLNGHGMLSAGHLNNDDRADAPALMRYGNMLRMLRQFDLPGVDAIWGQISYYENSTAGVPFFPRLASSAARQQGRAACVSESFAVYGAGLTQEEMRCAVNSQAVRGISLFNFMAVSYSKEGALCMQFRPNFIKEYPGTDNMRPINAYTARLSYIMQTGRADVRTALYYPQRTVCAGGEVGRKACEDYAALGIALEEQGVDFDIIDEEFVINAVLRDGVLAGEHTEYENVIVPQAELEPVAVTEKLNGTGRSPLPCVERKNPRILSRKLLFRDGSEGYFICNTGGTTAKDEIAITSRLYPCGVDLVTGELYRIPHRKENGRLFFPLRLTRGEGVMILLQSEPPAIKPQPREVQRFELRGLSAAVTRRTAVDPVRGIVNVRGSEPAGPGEWDAGFSGEVTYSAILSGLPDGETALDLGQVRHTAKIFLNGRPAGELTMPPYRIPLKSAKNGDLLEITVANTLANACRSSDFFSVRDPADVGPYHKIMSEREASVPAGGLIGPVNIIVTEETQ